jgi:Animal haem peroxidase
VVFQIFNRENNMSNADQQSSQHGQQALAKKDYYAMVSGATAPQPPLSDVTAWSGLAANFMTDEPDTPKDMPDPEENLMVPAGYTYFGQMVDHDLTFDTTSSLGDARQAFSNKRTPRFDLDCLYGPGPDDAPYMYEDGVRLVSSNQDLPRGLSGRAIIGDPRNDENSIVCQIQMAFIRFHNAVVDRLAMANPGNSNKDLFRMAQQEVRWTYQRILVEDYLPRIVAEPDRVAFDTLRGADPASGKTTKPAAFSLYPAGAAREKIPLEFAAAAYRFGHSMVRNGYRLNANTQKHVFSPSGPDSLLGFGELPVSHLIDWSLFFPNPDLPGAVPQIPPGQAVHSESATPGQHDAKNNAVGKERLQYAYKIDPMLVDPLAHLPVKIAGAGQIASLGLRNLRRGRGFDLPSGQEVAAKAGLPALRNSELVVRDKRRVPGKQVLTSIPLAFQTHTPLWLYILIEAHQTLVDWFNSSTRGPLMGQPFLENELTLAAAATTTQLRGVGARIVLETFHGLLDSDQESYRSDAAAHWAPLLKNFRMWDLVTCNLTGPQVAPTA